MMRTMVLLTRDLRARLRAASVKRGESQSRMIRQALEGHLSRLGYPKGSGFDGQYYDPLATTSDKETEK
jgi:hypothetical protein